MAAPPACCWHHPTLEKAFLLPPAPFIGGGGANDLRRRLPRRQVAPRNAGCMFDPPREASLISTTSGSNDTSQSCCCSCSSSCPASSTSPIYGVCLVGVQIMHLGTAAPSRIPTLPRDQTHDFCSHYTKSGQDRTKQRAGPALRPTRAMLNMSRLGPALKQKDQGLMLLGVVGTESKPQSAARHKRK